MSKVLLIFAFLLVASSFFAQDQLPKKATIVIKTPTNCDHCKVCETCAGLLEKDLYYVRGVKIVEYNEEAKTTTVTYKPKQVTPEKIRQEIAKLGFDADEVKADPKAYEKRDGCCKP